MNKSKSIIAVLIMAALFLATDAIGKKKPETPPPPKVDKTNMMVVAAGPFMMGDNAGEADERPVHQVELPKFWIDKTEVTIADYDKCVAAVVCTKTGDTASSDPMQPITFVNWQDASAYCGWLNKRLPTEAEWEKASRGSAGNKYPWGNEIDCTKANYRECGLGKTMPAGTYANSASPYKLLDMAGNVYEWVFDYYDPEYYKSSPAANPSGAVTGTYKVVRGGSFTRTVSGMRSADRAGFKPETKSDEIGFRCAYSEPPK